MPRLAITHVEVYVFRRRRGAIQFLALRRAPGRKLEGIWQPVTGKIEFAEDVVEAARREVREETGLVPRRMWRLERTAIYLDARGKSVTLLPQLAAEVGPSEAVRLSKEHEEGRFVTAREAGRLYLWDSQREALDAVRRQVLRGGRQARELEIGAKRPSSRAVGRRT